MVRSLKKGPFISYSLLKKVKYIRNKKHTILTKSRESTIIPKMIGYTIAVHRGNNYVPIFIVDQIVGYKLGEFVVTRIFYKTKKLSKKNKRLFLWDKKFIQLEFVWVIYGIRVRVGIDLKNCTVIF